MLSNQEDYAMGACVVHIGLGSPFRSNRLEEQNANNLRGSMPSSHQVLSLYKQMLRNASQFQVCLQRWPSLPLCCVSL